MKAYTSCLVIIGMILFSCTSKEKELPNKKLVTIQVPPPPDSVKADSLKPPQVILLSTRSAPERKTMLVPPKTKPAGFLAHMQTYTTDQGLALDATNCALTDQDGNLWFGTQGGGVSRYDGKSFTNFTTAQGLTNNAITSIEEDKKGNLWFGTLRGVSRYDGKTFINFTSDQGLANNTVWSIAEDNIGNLWFGTQSGGASCYDGKKFTNFTTREGLANNTVYSIFKDHTGMLWFGTQGGGASSYDGKTFTTVSTAQGLVNNTISSIAEDKKGNLWFGTLGGGVSRYDGKSFINFSTAQGLASNNITRVTADHSCNIWFSTDGSGVSCYDGKSFSNLNTTHGLISDNVMNITEDKSGNLWISTGGGVARYDGKIVTNFTVGQGLASDLINCITEDKKGNLWFGTYDKGASCYDGKSFTNFTTTQGLAFNSIGGITEDTKGNLWFGTYGKGVSCYNGKSFTNFTTRQGLASDMITCITEDKQSNLWFGTYGGGVSRYDGESFTNFTTAQGLAADIVHSIIEDSKGNLWFGTEGGGISRYNGKNFTNFTKIQGLAADAVHCILEDRKGNLWFGTEGGGVSRLSVKEIAFWESKHKKSQRKSFPFFENFTTVEGLAHDDVFDIVEDNQGNIVIGTTLGFSVLRSDISFLPFSKIRNKIEYYNSSNGFPIKDINSNAMYCDSEGIIWAGSNSTNTALVRFEYSALHKSNEALSLVIQTIKVNEENICWYSLPLKRKLKAKQDSSMVLLHEFFAYGHRISQTQRDSILKKFGTIRFDDITPFYPLPENLILPYKHNHISFEFAAIEPSKPYLVKYQYFLKGYDKGWSPLTEKTSASFGNIKEGTYTFILKAISREGLWSKPIQYSFKVLPPWYRTWWAYTIYFLSIVGGTFILFSYRTAALRRANLILEEKIEIRTAQLVQSLNSLQSTQAQLIQSEKLASLGELTAGIAHEIQNPLNFVNNFAEVSAEMLDEMHEELEKGDTTEAIAIATDLKTNLEKINHHGQRASAIVKGMLEHSRASTGVKEPTDINALADEYLRLAYHGLRAKDNNFNATMETHFDPELPKVSVIPQDIGRVLLNLINNAFYAIDEKQKQMATVESGTPLSESFRLSESYTPTITLRTKRLDNAVEIRIKDNGNGIPESIREKIFQPFFTTKPTGQGTGLGLSLAYDIVTKGHGGTLEVDTKKGENTAMIIRLPLQ